MSTSVTAILRAVLFWLCLLEFVGCVVLTGSAADPGKLSGEVRRWRRVMEFQQKGVGRSSPRSRLRILACLTAVFTLLPLSRVTATEPAVVKTSAGNAPMVLAALPAAPAYVHESTTTTRHLRSAQNSLGTSIDPSQQSNFSNMHETALTYGAPHLLRVSRASMATNTPSPCHSFRYDTTVLMADGTRKRIVDVEIGDRVLTTDPETGERVVREVTELHVNSDIDMANVTVRDADGNVSTIHTTQTHQFWSQTDNRWENASDLDEGELLRAFDGSKVTVVGVRTWDGYQTMYDLTIEGVHTYYVTAGNEKVLVHNCGEGMLGENGTQITSKTLTPPNRSYRIDVENPAPGVRPGQLHLQDAAGGKYLYNFETGVFEGIPKALAKEIAKDPAVARAIAKGASALGLG